MLLVMKTETPFAVALIAVTVLFVSAFVYSYGEKPMRGKSPCKAFKG